jgi:hypothetical protein
LCCSFTPFEVGWCPIGDAVPYAVWIVSRSQSHHHDTPGANPENGANRRRPFAVQILTQRDEGEEFADDFIDVACYLRRTRPELFVVEPDVFAAIAVENAVDRDRQPLDVRLGGRGPSWLRYCSVTFSPGRISQWPDRMATRLATDSGRPARRQSTAFRDGWTAWRRQASGNLAAPRNAVSPWEAGAPRSAASRWEAAANPWLGAITRRSRTESSNPSPSSEESDELRYAGDRAAPQS